MTKIKENVQDKLNQLDREFGKPCKRIFAPIKANELRIIIHFEGHKHYSARSYDVNGRAAMHILDIMRQAISRKGGLITSLKRKYKIKKSIED